MADSMNVTGANTGIDIARWRKLTAQEIIKEESKGAEIPPELVSWAQQMAAFANIPDDVTYEEVDGDVGIDALDKLGITPEEAGLAEPQAQNAVAPEQTEEPDAVQDPALVEEAGAETEDEQNIFMNATPGQAALTPQPQTAAEEEQTRNETLTLADTSLTTDPEEIRKRKRRLGLE